MTVAAFVCSIVVSDRFFARFPSSNAGLNTFRFQGVPEPVGVIPAIPQHPLCCRNTIQQGGGTDIIVVLSPSHEKDYRSSALIGDRMQLRVHATFGATDQAT